jgi:3D (Asp-Asp-Asp) domain-containing protein
MRIISLMIALPLLYISFIPQHALAADLNANETKINFEIKELFNTPIPYNFAGYIPIKEKESKKFIINASAYTAAADECGKSDGITASGKKVQENRTLACPKGYKFGTKIKIKGYGTYVCEDRGGAIKGNHFDIYMETKAQAFAFGRRNLEAEVVEI